MPRTGGLKLSGVFRARSGTPISLRNTTFDNDRNGSTQNEYLRRRHLHRRWSRCELAERDSLRGRIRRRPGWRRAVRATRRRICAPATASSSGDGRTLDAFLDVFNLGNRANFANPSVDQRLPATFLRLLDVSDEGPTRTAQINLRFGF